MYCFSNDGKEQLDNFGAVIDDTVVETYTGMWTVPNFTYFKGTKCHEFNLRVECAKYTPSL